MAPNDAKSKCKADADMQQLFSYIDGNRERFLGDLDEAIRIKSVSAWPDNRKVGESLREHIFLRDESFLESILGQKPCLSLPGKFELIRTWSKWSTGPGTG